MKKHIIFYFLFFSNLCYSQEYSRDVVITIDTVVEMNNTRKFGKISDSYINEGVEIKVFETPFQIQTIVFKKSNLPEGNYLEFYLPSNMPRVKGNYINGDQNGEWFYWAETGRLLKKENWKKGKLLSTVNCK